MGVLPRGGGRGDELARNAPLTVLFVFLLFAPLPVLVYTHKYVPFLVCTCVRTFACGPVWQSLGLLSEEEISRVPDFQGHARHFEKDFFEDMEAMNVKAPDCLTRVTEYMPEVVAFIQGIVDKGYAYVSSGSVYFDTVKYRADGRRYPKIKADSSADVSLLRDGDSLFACEVGLLIVALLLRALIGLQHLVSQPCQTWKRMRNVLRISLSGKRPWRESHRGIPPGGRDVLVGILSAQQWPGEPVFVGFGAKHGLCADLDLHVGECNCVCMYVTIRVALVHVLVVFAFLYGYIPLHSCE